MRSSRHNALTQLLHLLAGTGSFAHAISISNFDSTASPGSLSSTCEAVFVAAIPDCTVSDFEPSPACSHQCLAGLEQINAQVAMACSSGSVVNPNSLLGAFVAGQGIQLLCNVVVTTTTAIAQTTTVEPATPAAVAPMTMATPPAAATSALSPMPADDSMTQPSTTMTIAAPATSTRTSSSSSSSMTTRTTSKTTGANAAAAVVNPSKPTCSGGGTIGDGGSPFDSFSDQLCSKKSNTAVGVSLSWRTVGLGIVGCLVAWAVS